MNVTVERVENEATLKITAPAAEVNAGYKKAVQKIADQANIPGFRKGKAPRAIIEMHYGKEAVKQEAFEIVANKAYSEALDQEKLIPVSDPKVEESTFEEGKDMELTIKVTLKPEPELGEYKGLHVEKKEVEVTDEQVDAQIKDMMGRDAKMVVAEEGAVIEKGDFAIIDFAGTVDGEPFSGGEGKGYPLEVGSNSFIPGFEDQLVGAKAGDHVEVKVTFPEEYQAKELAGKEAVFQCDVKKVEAKELPELDDDFAQDASEFDTLAEYKEDIKKNLTEKKEKEARAAKENAAVDKAIENAQMEIPDAMLNTQVRQMLDDFSRRMQSQGLTMEQYFQFTGMTLEKMQEEMKPQALKRIQTRLVLEKIAEVENIQPTDEEVEEEFKKMADAYKMEVEKIKELLGDRELEQMKKDMAVQKAVTLVADEA